MDQQLVIGVPGEWPDRAAIFQAIMEKSGGYYLAAESLLHPRAKSHWQLDIYPHQPSLRKAFEVAGRGKLQPDLLDRIEGHNFCLYVISDDLSVASARAIMAAGCGLLRSGGLAVKVESSGTAHAARTWIDRSESSSPWDVYCCLVTLITGNDTFYSCGMHQLGLPDASVPMNLSPEEAAEAINVFNMYQLSENPNLATGHNFSTAPNARVFRLAKAVCPEYPPEDLFHNPWGRWHLS